MFSSRAVNHEINRLHERALRLNDETSTFNDMLSKSNDITVNEKKYSKIDDWILQTTQQPFHSHNERSFHKTNPQV